MKNSIQFSLICLALLLTGAGCEEQDLPECVEGIVIGYEYCSKAVLVQVENQLGIGNEITYYNDSVYQNVVKAPDKEGGSYQIGDTIYFNYRVYDKETDYDLFYSSDTPCLMYPAPFDIPILVITNYSTSNCPLSHEK